MKKPLFIFVFIITFSIFLSSTVFANSYTVTIHASDPYDYYVRDWNIFTVDPSGTYVGGEDSGFHFFAMQYLDGES